MGMHLPHLQVTQETWDLANQLAGLTEAPFEAAFTGLCELWRWGLKLGPDTEPPMGICESTLAVDRMATVMRWKLDRPRLVTVLVDLGLVELRPTGLRVRGMRRYWPAWRKNHKEAWAVWSAAHPDLARTVTEESPDGEPPGTGRSPGGKRPVQAPQTQTQTHKQIEKPPPPTPSAQLLALVPPPDEEVVVEHDSCWARRELDSADKWLCWKRWRRGQLGLSTERETEDQRVRIASLLEHVRIPERLCAAYDAYVRDKTLRAADQGWPLAVFLTDAIVLGRLPPLEAYA